MKNKSKSLLTIIILALVTTFQSCWDVHDVKAICNSGCTTIEGRITTEDGYTPVKDIVLELDGAIQSGYGFFGSKTRRIAKTRTDENGHYKFDFYPKDQELLGGYFIVKFKPPDNFYVIQKEYSYFMIFGVDRRDTLITRNYHIPKKGGTINLKIKNPQDIKGEDVLITKVSFKFDDLTKNIEFGEGELSSNYASQISIPTAVNQYSYLRTSKKINGVYSNYLDSVMVNGNEVIYYEIEF